MRVVLIGGANLRRSIIAGVERCENLYIDANEPSVSPVPFTYYPRPGLIKRAQRLPVQPNPVQAIFQSVATGQGYCVIAGAVFKLNADWTLVYIGAVSNASTLIKHWDAGNYIVLVDGSNNGWKLDVFANTVTMIVDPTGTFVGSRFVAGLETFMIAANPGTNLFNSSLSNTLTWDPTYVAALSQDPSEILGFVVVKKLLLLIQKRTSELWYNAGSAAFPFAAYPGVFFEQGCVAPYSIATNDLNTFWLSRDKNGVGFVVKQSGYDCVKISNSTLEFAISQMPVIDDAVGNCFQLAGKMFYILTFPTADQTWVWEATNPKDWVRWGWTDPNTGILHRHRGLTFGCVYNKCLVGDWGNGTIYEQSLTQYQDDTADVHYVRTVPHLSEISGPSGPMTTDGNVVTVSQIKIDMECGTVNGATVALRWSRDRGRTWSTDLLQSTGNVGEYQTQPMWNINARARDIVFEIEWKYGPAALNGVWLGGVAISTER